MPTTVARGIRPRRVDEQVYHRYLRRHYSAPIFKDLIRNVGMMTNMSNALKAIHGADTVYPDSAWLREHFEKVSQWHRKRLIATLRTAISVDVGLIVTQEGIRQVLETGIQANVDFIVSIQKDLLGQVGKDLQKAFLEKPFDQEELTRIFRETYKKTDYPLRRLARDQHNKLVSRFTEVRQTQLGIDGYIWSSSVDDRVRKTHVEMEGKYVAWNMPPPIGHAGMPIQCRCTANPVILQEDKDRLRKAIAAQKALMDKPKPLLLTGNVSTS